jgi:hypothetical protein
MMVIFGHVISCAIAIGFAFFADFRVLKARGKLSQHDVEIVEQVSHFVALAMGALWISGIAIVLIDFGHLPSLSELMDKPKMAAKLSVVVALTVNGFMLHLYALPRLRRLDLVAALMGGVSAASWLVAAFLGVARPIATLLTYGQFMGLYVLALMAGLCSAGVVFRSHQKTAASRPAAYQAFIGYPVQTRTPQMYHSYPA